jgi:hypothetical protein
LQSQNNLKKNFHRHITTSAAGASQQVQWLKHELNDQKS